MKHQNITVTSISDPTGTQTPSAGANGCLGPVALDRQVIKSINDVNAVQGGFNFISDGTIEVVPISAGNILLRLYLPIAGSLSVTPNNAEIGQTLTVVQLNWALNKNEASQSLNNGIGVVSNGIRSYMHTTSINSDRTYTLTATDGRTTTTPSATVNFSHRRFWGTTTTSVDISAAELHAGTSELSNSRNKGVTFTTSNEFIYYAYPVAFGLATVKDGNGFTFTDWRNGGIESTDPYIIAVTNTYGYTENYYVYHSFNQYFGSVTFNWQ